VVTLVRPGSVSFVLVILVLLLLLLPSTSSAAAVTSAPRSPVVAVSSPTHRRNRSTAAPTNTTSSNGAWRNGWKSGAASASAAACVKTLLQPIDAIKTVQQFHEGTAALSLWAACQQLASRPGGLGNFYAGLGVTVLGALPGVSLYFGVYSYCKERWLATAWGQAHPTATVAVSAAIGNTVASFSRVPYEVLKQKLQAGIYPSTAAAFRDIVKHPSLAMELLFPRGGIWGQMIRDVPYAVVTLLVYESLQSHFNNNSSNNSKSTPQQQQQQPMSRTLNFLLGGAAGGIGSWVTTPMDVVKTRVQTLQGGGSVLQVTRQVWQEGGAPAFLRGAVPRLMHKVPANALFFYFYEFFKLLYRVETSSAGATLPKATAKTVANKK
jgi:solute carrier family 25 S-adenosylmethionine transporter 26